MTKRTLGAIVNDLSQKSPDSRDPIEIQRELQKDYMKNLLEAVDRGYKKYPSNFFIHVETKAEPLLPNTFRNYFIDKQCCPTPNYDQSVFRYNREAGQIEYLWTIPDRETCHHFKANAAIIAPEERGLLSFILKFDSGELLRLCKKYNGEEIDTPQLVKG